MKITLFYLLLFCAALSYAQAPEGYYAATEGLNGQALKNRLHKIIRNHKVRTYAEFRDLILPDLDEDPENPDHIMLFYKIASIPKSNFASNNQPDYWNREHTWPKSHGFPGTADTAYTDVHNLRPSDASINTSKSNKDFHDIEDSAENAEGEAPDTYTNADFWEPRGEIKGDVARILLYMDVRYESEALDLEIVDRKSYSGDPELGVLFTLLHWHLEDPVDEAERERHEKAYGYQENRNPFIDHPEWVSAIWGDVAGPYLTLNAPAFNPDFGTVTYGESLTQVYDINAYHLEGNVTISAESPFFLSKDNQHFFGEVTYSPEELSEDGNFRVYLKFEPQQSDEQLYQTSVTHATAGFDGFDLQVKAREGELSLSSITSARQQTLGSVVRVTGVVIDAGNNSGNSRVIYDGTAGIVVRSFDADNESSALVQGDSVVVSGGLSEYGGVLQIEVSPITIELVKQGAQLPEPQEVTISEVGENYESELVVIRDVRFNQAGGTFAGGGSAGNFDITDETGAMIFRIGSASHPLVGSTIPSGRFDVTGFVGEFAGKYQMSARDLNDLVKVEEAEDETQLEIITIAAARTKPEGEVVKVTGIVIGGEHNSNYNRVIYDGTAGLVVRSLDAGSSTGDLQIGDSVVVQGGLLNYNGLLEIEQQPVIMEIISKGHTLPDPQPIRLADVGETYESELVVVQDVSFVESGTFAAGIYTLTDGSSDTRLRIGLPANPLVGIRIPYGKINLTGYVGQDNDGYQLFIRAEEDLVASNDALGTSYVKETPGLVYPNPASDRISIQVPEEGPLVLKIFDIGGRLVRWQLIKDRTVDVSQLESAIYILLVKHQGATYYHRLIKN